MVPEEGPGIMGIGRAGKEAARRGALRNVCSMTISEKEE
jgi:hypothetical protein